METNIVICVLVGLPGAGKSTLAEKLNHTISYLSECEFKIINFSFDDFVSLEDQEKLVRESKNNSDCKAFKDARSSFIDSVVDVISAIKTCAVNESCREYFKTIDIKQKRKYVLVLDDNFYYKSMRYKFFQIASNFNCGFCQVYLECNHSVAEERNRKRSKNVSSEVIQTMRERLEPPCQSRSWESQSVCIRSEEVDLCFKDIRDLITSNFENGLSVPEDDSLERGEAHKLNLTSLLHRADLILRALVGEKMRNLKQRNHKDKSSRQIPMKEASSIVNIVRQDILAKLKNKSLSPPHSILQMAEISQSELDIFLKGEFENGCIVYNL